MSTPSETDGDKVSSSSDLSAGELAVSFPPLPDLAPVAPTLVERGDDDYYNNRAANQISTADILAALHEGRAER